MAPEASPAIAGLCVASDHKFTDISGCELKKFDFLLWASLSGSPW